VDVPYQETLEAQDDERRNEHEEDVRLVVERGDGLGGRANLGEEGELAGHGRVRLLGIRHGFVDESE